MKIVQGNAGAEWLLGFETQRNFALTLFQGGGAGVLSYVELYNPAASGVIVRVYGASFTVGVAGGIGFQFFNAALTTDGGAGINLTSGGSAAAAHLYSETSASLGS